MTRLSFLAVEGVALGLVVALASLGGLLLDSAYAKETLLWSAQGQGQDWVDLLVVAPWLMASGVLAARGSSRALVLHGGAVVYTLYSFVLYAFCMHFNRLFPLYCGALGLSAFGLGAVVVQLMAGRAEDLCPGPGARRFAAVVEGLVALLFTLLWLQELVPALVEGQPPKSVTDAGLIVNPVHVLDLSVLLPAMAMTAHALWRGSARAVPWGAIFACFAILMSVAIVAMMLVMRARGEVVAVPVLVTMGALVVPAAVVLWQLTRPARPTPRPWRGHGP